MKKKHLMILALILTAMTANAQSSMSPPPTADFSASPTTICTGGRVMYTDMSSGATSYQWSFPGGTPSTDTAKNPVVLYSIPGVYGAVLIATNRHGSDTKIKSAYISVNALPSIPVISQNASTLTSSPADSYLWSTGETTQSITVSSNGIYSVVITNSSGCSASSGVDSLFDVGINTPFVNNALTIFPDPFTTQASIQMAGSFENGFLTVYNSFGQVVRRLDNISGETIVFSRDDLSNGIYYFRFIKDNTAFTGKAIIEN
jgi:hypothetical protein